MAKKIKSIVLAITAALFCSSSVVGVENTGRFFPFSARPEKSLYKKGFTADVDFFYSSGRSIAQEDRTPLGVGEYGGKYDLRDIVFAMDTMGIPTEEIKQFVGTQNINDPVLFNVHGKVRGGGGVLRYALALPGLDSMPLSFGASLPFMYVESDVRYSLNTPSFMDSYFKYNPSLLFGGIDTEAVELIRAGFQERIDHARRIAHQAIGLKNNYWSVPGIGDLDLFVSSNLQLDHKFMMRSVDIAVQYGVIIPTGVQRENNIVSSVPFMNDGHWSFYVHVAPTFELKRDLKCGFMIRGQHFIANTKDRQLPIFKESFLYSPLVGSVRVQPGATLIFNSFLVLENVYDGLHLQGRYTYKRHKADKWKDMRTDKTIPSYLSRKITDGAPGGQSVTDEMITNIISAKEYLSKFRSHYITIQLTYDPLEAQQELLLKPKFFASIEAPVFDASRGIVQANQISVGAELHF
jgi:hypothetical protein